LATTYTTLCMHRSHPALQMEAVCFSLAPLHQVVHIVPAAAVLLYNSGLADCFRLLGELGFGLGQRLGLSYRLGGNLAAGILEGRLPFASLVVLDLLEELALDHFSDSPAMRRWVVEPSDCTEIKVAGLELMRCDSDTLGERGYSHLSVRSTARRPGAAARHDLLDPRENRRTAAKPFPGFVVGVGVDCK